MSDKPIQCRKVLGAQGYWWEITHKPTPLDNRKVVAWFTHGDEALRYLNTELTKWEQRERGKALARTIIHYWGNRK